jgi:hypothetical protein
MLLCSTGNLFLVHIMDLDFVIRTRKLPNRIDCFLAGRAPCAENLNFVSHNRTSPFLYSIIEAPSA